MNAAAYRAISAIVFGVSPPELQMPALLKYINLAVTGQAVGHGRVPIVHGSGEVLKKDERNTFILSKTTISRTQCASAIHELGRCCLMSVWSVMTLFL